MAYVMVPHLDARHRSAMTELGVGLFTSPTGVNNTIGRVTTGQFPAPAFDQLTSTKESSKFGSAVTTLVCAFLAYASLDMVLLDKGRVDTLAGGQRATGADGPGRQAGFGSPRGVAVAPDGSVYVVDAKEHALRHVTGL